MYFIFPKVYLLCLKLFIEQAATVEEHFQALIDDDSSIDDKIEKSSYENLPEWYNEELFKA